MRIKFRIILNDQMSVLILSIVATCAHADFFY